MGTKTISIMDDAYGLLMENKLEEESFSDEIRRIICKKRTKSLTEFFGIISEEEGAEMLKDLEKVRTVNLKRLKDLAWKY